MSINNHVPDETFVKAIANLVHPTPRLEALRPGQHIFTAGKEHEIIGEPLEALPDTLHITTLSGIVDAVEKGLGIINPEGPAILVQVDSPYTVDVIAPSVGKQRQRFTFVRAAAITPGFNFGNYYDIDSFIVGLQSAFLDSDNRFRTLEYVGKLTAGLATDIEDNGVTQEVTARKGITRVGAPVAFENPIFLQPFCTFSEVEQPGSPFILRLRQEKDGEQLSVRAALIEADGGMWRKEAINNIAVYLRAHLPEGTIVLA